MSDHLIGDDTELRERVYAETGYANTSDELSQSTLDTLILDAKMIIDTRLDTTQWYDDKGLTLVLLGTVCTKAKAHVENYSVESWNFTGGSITARDADGTSIQMNEYQSMIEIGMQSRNAGQTQTPTLSNTHSYIGGR